MVLLLFLEVKPVGSSAFLPFIICFILLPIVALNASLDDAPRALTQVKCNQKREAGDLHGSEGDLQDDEIDSKLPYVWQEGELLKRGRLTILVSESLDELGDHCEGAGYTEV